MSGGTVAALATGVFGLISGVVAAVLSYRAQRNTAKADEVAAVFEAYDELIKNLQAELDRHRRSAMEEIEGVTRRLEQATVDLHNAEDRCRECRGEVGDLLADLAALRSIVVDEIARSAADAVLDDHHEHVNDEEAAELDAIKQFLKRLPPDQRP